MWSHISKTACNKIVLRELTTVHDSNYRLASKRKVFTRKEPNTLSLVFCFFPCRITSLNLHLSVLLRVTKQLVRFSTSTMQTLASPLPVVISTDFREKTVPHFFVAFPLLLFVLPYRATTSAPHTLRFYRFFFLLCVWFAHGGRKNQFSFSLSS